MDAPVNFTVFVVFSMVVIVVSGVNIIQSLTRAMEAKYEFHGDTLTKRSRLKGFVFFGLWLLASTVNWSFVFDWYLTGSSQIAFERLSDKAYLIFILLEAMSND